MFQGLRALRERNWAAPPVEPARLDAVLLSHAHIDHSGYLPRLARDGFTGPIFCSPGTADLLRIMLPDAARLQEEEADYRNRAGSTRHRPALPLFAEADARRALRLVRETAFGEAFAPADGLTARFHPSGHILGASIVEVTAGGRRLVYSGDLGRYHVPIMRDPAPIAAADTLLVESTYGDRDHPADDGTPVLVEAVQRAVARRGILLVPAFAIGRTQDLLYLLRELESAGRAPRIPVYLDSPMAIEATVVYARHPRNTMRRRRGSRRRATGRSSPAASTCAGRPRTPNASMTSRARRSSSSAAGWQRGDGSCTTFVAACPTRALPGSSSVPGRRDAGTRAARGDRPRTDLRRRRAGASGDHGHRCAQRACRSRRADALARRLQRPARRDLVCPRRAAGRRGAPRRHPGPAQVGM
jgi:glyoxylase-like metal-dependent hydrolase (beta-lactamase superfamily II)